MELTYNYLFEDKEIFEKLGRFQYYGNTYLKAIKENKKIKSRIIKAIWNTFFPFFHRRCKNPNVLLLDYKFEKIYKEQKDSFNFFIICNSLIQAKDHLSERNVFFPNRWIDLINESFLSHNMSSANKAIERIKHFLKKYNIKVVLLGNDKLFIEKAILFAAMNTGVPTIVIQHGIYNLDSFRKLHTSYCCDYFWVWSEYVKKIYLDVTKKNPDNVKVIGYPFDIPKFKRAENNTILFLGNHYKSSDLDEGMKYLEIAKEVYHICQKHNYSFRYRPHPSEIIDDDYGELLSTEIKKGISLDEDLDRYDVIVGDVSSAMVEAAMRGKKVIQIIWSERSRIGIEDPLYSFTIKCNIEDIEQTIISVIESNERKAIDEYYVKVNPEFKKTVRNLLLKAI